MDAADIITGESVEVKFFTSYHRPLKDQSEVLSTESKTERAYIPPAELIKDMLASGEALLAARKARYDSDLVAEGEEIELDPTRNPGVDLVDLQRLGAATSARLADQEAAAAKAAGEKAAADAAARDEARIQAEVEKRLAGAAAQPVRP